MPSDRDTSHDYNHRHHRHGVAAHPGEAKDPVCGMIVNPTTAKHRATHEGVTYWFCSEGCRSKFMADPGKYAGQPIPVRSAVSAPAGTVWTCPMYPEIRRDEPGSCPICGMALEPEMPSAESGPSPELVDMKRRFWISAALAAPIFLLEMSAHVIELHMIVSGQALNWVQLVLASPVVLWGGWPFFERGWASINNRSLNMFTLIAMGIGVAWLYSLRRSCRGFSLPRCAGWMAPCRSISRPLR